MDPNNVKLEHDSLVHDDKFKSSPTEQSEEKFHLCQVCNLISTGFHKYSKEEQLEIIQKGRAIPQLENLFSNTAAMQQAGCSKLLIGNWYDTEEWLTGCEKKSKLYCWPCLLFSDRNNPWVTTGVSDVSNLPFWTKSHSIWDIHIEAMYKWKTFGKEIPKISGDDESLDYEESEKIVDDEEITKNRKILKKFIHIICFLGVHELCLSEADEDFMDPIDQTKYEAFISFIAKYDHFLSSQLSCGTVFLSPSFRNNLVSSVSSTTISYIFDEISRSSFVSMILDEVAEMDDTILISTILRFTNAMGDLVERFFNFRRIPSDREADSLFNVINENVNILDCASKLVAISCDGGVLKTNEIFQFQSKIRLICPNTCFLHYHEHRVNTVLAQSLSNIKECKLFFWILNGLAMTFFKSKKMRDELDKLIRKKKPGASEFRWSFNGSLINNVFGIRQSLIDLFQSIVDNSACWDFESVSASNWFLPKFTNDLSFNFLLLLLGDIFERADILSSNLVFNSENIDLCIQHVKEYNNFIKSKQNSYDIYHYEAVNLVCHSEIPIKREKNMNNEEPNGIDSCKKIFNAVFSNIITQLNSRFGELWRIKFISFIDFENREMNSINPGVLYHSFDKVFVKSLLLTELSALREWKAIKRPSEREILKYLRLMDLSSTFPQTTKLCELTMTLPISKGKSTLERVERYIQTTSLKHRLSPMAILKIEQDFILELSKNPKFYDKIIAEFAEREPSLPLIYAP